MNRIQSANVIRSWIDWTSERIDTQWMHVVDQSAVNGRDCFIFLRAILWPRWQLRSVSPFCLTCIEWDDENLMVKKVKAKMYLVNCSTNNWMSWNSIWSTFGQLDNFWVTCAMRGGTWIPIQFMANIYGKWTHDIVYVVGYGILRV